MHFSLKNFDIKRFVSNAQSMKTPLLTMKYLPEENYKYSVVVSKKKGNAVERNKIKRLLRDMMRLNLHSLPKGYYLIYFTSPCGELEKNEIQNDFLRIIPAFKVKSKTTSSNI